MATQSPSLDDLLYQVHHIILPTKLPSHDDWTKERDRNLVTAVLDAMVQFQGHLDGDDATAFSVATDMIRKMHACRPQDQLDKESVLQTLGGLVDGDAICFHIRSQNFGLLITRNNDIVRFEPFELLATNHEVVNSRGSLQRTFPSLCTELSSKQYKESSFQSALAHILVTLDAKDHATCLPLSGKGNQEEVRDTVDPRLMIMLSGILRGLGHAGNVIQIRKRSREEVLWNSAERPFHRSATWLHIRVCLQLVLSRTHKTGCFELFKGFTLHLVKVLMEMAMSSLISFPNHLLFCMAGKLNRRMMKQPDHVRQSGCSPSWYIHATITLGKAMEKLEHTWDIAQRSFAVDLDLEALKSLDFSADTRVTTSSMNQYLDNISVARHIDQSQKSFGDSYPFKLLPRDVLPEASFAHHLRKSALLLELADLELWVTDNLPEWACEHLTDSDACQRLGALIEGYHWTAHRVYANDPLSLAIMWLTILEIWVVLDRSATYHIPLLLDYMPGISNDLLLPLTLPLRSQMARLHEVEAHIHKRNRIGTSTPSIFEEFGHPDSFAVRYFAGSQSHKDLLERLRNEATAARDSKLAELAEKQASYQELTRQFDNLAHNQYTTWNNARKRYDTHCNPGCYRCSLDRQMKAVTIHIWENPLPSQPSHAEALVFELQAPKVIIAWRRATMGLLIDKLTATGKPLRGSEPKRYSPMCYTELSAVATTFKESRLSVLSIPKPFRKSHYQSREVGKPILKANESNIIEAHACRYNYEDNKSWCDLNKTIRASALPLSCSFAHNSRFVVPEWIHDHVHTSNEVIAAQSKCPPSMSLDEFKAIGHLRSGCRLQWLNILAQLKIPSIGLNDSDAARLFLQAAYEAGPCNDIPANFLRDSHAIVDDKDFALSMTQGLKEAVLRVKENWECDVALFILTGLCTRILALSSNQVVKKECFSLLAELRAVSRYWAAELRIKQANASLEVDRNNLHQRVLSTALICAYTFGATGDDIQSVLSDKNAVLTLIEVSIHIHDHVPSDTNELPISSAVAYHHWRRLCHLARPVIIRMINDDRSCLDQVVSAFWTNFEPGTNWIANNDSGHGHVLDCFTSQLNGKKNHVSYDLFEGTLLVNGQPLSRLPRDYENHPTYQRLCDTQSLEVGPSAEADMSFSAAERQNGWIVYFDLRDTQLLVRAKKRGEMWEFVPPQKLDGDLPHGIICPYAHWRNVHSGDLHFRPLDRPWNEENLVWQAVKQGDHYVVRNGQRVLINPRSKTAEALHEIFDGLEDRRHIIITYDQTSQELNVNLARYDLDFTLKQGQGSLRARKYPGFCVSPKQGSIGTFIGLTSQLVLHPENWTRTNRRSTVIVPHGVLHSQAPGSYRYGGHDQLIRRIEPTQTHVVRRGDYATAIARCQHHSFEVDGTLGRLVDKGSIRSKLLLCHIHALTSGLLPDPLLGKTGTEEALRILRSAALVSFQRLKNDEAEMLTYIAQLSPVRTFYPKHLRVMEHVEWSPESPLLQNDEFHSLVDKILEHRKLCKVFEAEKDEEFPSSVGSNPGLRERALVRTASFRVAGFGAEHFSKGHDSIYQGRDLTAVKQLDVLETRVCGISRILLGGAASLVEPIHDPNDLVMSLYDILGTKSTRFPVQKRKTLTLGRFEISWLDQPNTTIGKHWLALTDHLRQLDLSSSKYELMGFFAGLVFSDQAHFNIIQLLLSVVMDSVKRENPPHFEYQISQGRQFDSAAVRGILLGNSQPFLSTTEGQLPQQQWESPRAWEGRRSNAWHDKLGTVSSRLVMEFASQFTSNSVQIPPDQECREYFKMDEIKTEVESLFQGWTKNIQLHNHLGVIASAASILPKLRPATVSLLDTPCARPVVISTAPRPRLPFIDFAEIFEDPAPEFTCKPPLTIGSLRAAGYEVGTSASPSNTSNDRLPAMLELIGGLASQPHEHDYVEELEQSLMSSQDQNKTTSLAALGSFQNDYPTLEARLEGYDARCSLQVIDIWELMRYRMASVPRLGSGHFAPRNSPMLLLEQLNRHHWPNLPDSWRHFFVQHALAITHRQRAGRLLAAHDKPKELIKELENVGHSWDLHAYPESLLLEAESGLIIRDVQESVAAPMRSATENRTLQLNMGQGKSSVIVQIVAAHLADGERLVRVIVAKPQSKQMHHMLVSKLGGLLDRRVFFLPFSRSLIVDMATLDVIKSHLEVCRTSGGVLLTQPEQLLSFKLMGVEYVGCSGEDNHGSRIVTGRELIKTQQYMDKYSRDIIDESDENFSVKFELIYTIGSQAQIDMSPDRWIIIQQVLSLLPKFAQQVQKRNPSGIELGRCNKGEFPRLRFLEEGAGLEVLDMAARHICENGIHRLPISHQAREVRAAILKFITERDLSADAVQQIETLAKGVFETEAKNALLLLRGLFSCGILGFCFGQKRWRVNYGLADRTPQTSLAVPYRAKDCPSLRSEYSQPDVVIVLTCLSYYYDGLGKAHMMVAFEQLGRSDQAETIYGNWVTQVSQLDPAFQQLSGVNLKDGSCRERIFPALSHSKAVVDFFLDKVVFPKEMLEFPSKVSSSGWDLATKTTYPTTGFSGTCDSKAVLPLGISHMDLPEQRHTNATVLDCLLREENLVLELQPRELQPKHLTAKELVELVVGAEPRVDCILDLGAIIDDLDNEQVARQWLDLSPENKQGVIFVNDVDDIVVVDRQGFVEPFITSPFANNTEACLVFLDEAHTRGIDLSLPDHYRAATTLGPKITKDRLVQACMRMRKLGKGQSITFFATREIQDKIRQVCHWIEGKPLGVQEVLCWSIAETWVDTRRSVQLWMMQGLRHCRQKDIWERKIVGNDQLLLARDLEGYFEKEAMDLELRYAPNARNTTEALLRQFKNVGLSAERAGELELLHEKTKHFGITVLTAAALEEEQERELAPEIEQERQIEKPAAATPLAHVLHVGVEKLIAGGCLRADGPASMPAFRSLGNCSAAKGFDLWQFGRRLLATADFSKTVRLEGLSTADAFQRPVQWVLTFRGDHPHFMVILSPFEANLLLPRIRQSKSVFLHLYVPRPSLTLPSLQDLTLYSAPRIPDHWTAPVDLVMQLKLFAGELYFRTYEEYRQTCAFLGLASTPNCGTSAIVVSADGFVGQSHMYPSCDFTKNPIPFLRFLESSVRRDRQDIEATHVGKMLTGNLLVADDFMEEKEDGKDKVNGSGRD